jgi:hypothetical protein
VDCAATKSIDKGCHLQENTIVCGGTYAADILLTYRCRRFAILLDGPQHLVYAIHGPGVWSAGATAMRDWNLRSWGIAVVRVPVDKHPASYFSGPAFRNILAEQLMQAGLPVGRAGGGGGGGVHAEVGVDALSWARIAGVPEAKRRRRRIRSRYKGQQAAHTGDAGFAEERRKVNWAFRPAREHE